MLEIWKDYVNRLAATLRAEGEQAGILRHGGLKGDVREHFVSTFLRAFLPDTVEVGRGEIFDRHGQRPNSIDVVIYDRSFPIPTVGNNTKLFPVEAVIATIEVKSRLNALKLAEALDNTASVQRLRPRAMIVQSIGHETDESAHPNPDPTVGLFDFTYPGTYVFGYQGYKRRAEVLAEAIARWFQKHITEVADVPAPQMLLPRVVATQTSLWFRRADDLQITLPSMDFLISWRDRMMARLPASLLIFFTRSHQGLLRFG